MAVRQVPTKGFRLANQTIQGIENARATQDTKVGQDRMQHCLHKYFNAALFLQVRTGGQTPLTQALKNSVKGPIQGVLQGLNAGSSTPSPGLQKVVQ